MQVFVNQKEVSTSATHLDQLIAELGLPAQGVAAAVDNKMVTRTAWATFALSEGAHITVIKAACGG